MKIAIQGHPTRGKEVIQILESLGGINTELKGTFPLFYYIDNKNEITNERETSLRGYKLYTLEEFETEFPFKIGDKVIYDYTPNFVGTVVDIKFDDNIPYRVDIEGTVCTCGTMMLKPYKEMKEERNITLTLDKAKEWYNKGGELREIALQAFSEKELNSLPRSWEDYSENYCIEPDEAYIDSRGNILSFITTTTRKWNHICPSKKSAEAHLAMIQLEQLRNCWWGDWKPEYNRGTKYIIKWDKDDLIFTTSGRIRAFLIFPTREMAEGFLRCFRDLIEKAGDLI